ncbi:hypothetical protein F4820DRAFT_464437 [Hypoxylon rubiginosum]|uniref:Uncharacterized protein n=1 Tax=Hypoxylon rubiginosum TaxID=110542 RepID=A0ACB9YRC4_9PEZI|nr:hypothetical protein F4820DRAFT_464437 [Hypoxylon rubiginosum]
MLRRGIITASICASIVGAIPAALPEPTPVATWQDRKIEQRQQQPFSIPGVIPSAVDTRYYNVDGSTTKFIGTTTAFLSVPTVTGTSSGKTITTTQTASMAIYSAKPKGQSDYEYSLVVAPELADEIAAVLTTSSKRDLDERGVPLGVVEALIELLGPKVATSVLQVVNLAATAGVPALSTVAAGVVEIGGLAIAGAAFLTAIANQFALIADVLKNDGKVTAVVVPNPFDNFRDTKTCPSTHPKCSSCGGQNLICTTGSNNKCPCDEDDKCKTGKDGPDCGNPNCKGNDANVCTTGDQKGCSCDVLEMIDVQPILPNVGWLDTQQKYIQSIIDFGAAPRASPSNNPTCGSRESEGLGGYLLLGHNQINDSSHATPREILYMMRETLCNDKCENPQYIQTKSVKTTKKGNDGCEIAIALSGNIEAWAVRDAHSRGEQWQDCWDSLANATEKCTNMNEQDGHATGWVNGPDDYEYFQIGYRALNSHGALHGAFGDGDGLPQWCGDAKPKCDTCMGGGSGNRCSTGEFSGCDCEPVAATQPEVPTATNCATAIAAAEIICCGWSDDTKKTCAQTMQGCGVTPDLGAVCQSAVDPTGGQVYQTCGQFGKDDPIVRGTHGDDTAKCLVEAFNLKADLKYH